MYTIFFKRCGVVQMSRLENGIYTWDLYIDETQRPIVKNRNAPRTSVRLQRSKISP